MCSSDQNCSGAHRTSFKNLRDKTCRKCCVGMTVVMSGLMARAVYVGKRTVL